MTWEDISLKKFLEIEGKEPAEILLILGEDMTISEFKKESWEFLGNRRTPKLPKNEYIIDGVVRKPTLDIRKLSVKQYLAFSNSKDINSQLNAIFGTEDVDYGNMSIVDVEDIMSFFVMQWQTCIKGIRKYLKKKKLPEILQKQLDLLENLVLYSSLKA